MILKLEVAMLGKNHLQVAPELSEQLVLVVVAINEYYLYAQASWYLRLDWLHSPVAWAHTGQVRPL